MPYNSAEISGLVGGQMAMFSNQASYAQQIGGIYGTGPQTQPSNMQNPYPQPKQYGMPDYGSQYFGGGGPGGAGSLGVGMVGNALPMAAAGVSLGAGLIGGGMGMLDPFTGVARAFSHGVGATAVGGGGSTLGGAMMGRGAGFMETIGHTARGFSGAGGFARGAGMLGRGLAVGAVAAAPYIIAGEAIAYAGGQMYQGAQNIAQVGEIMGRQGPAYGQAGVRPGGQMARQQIKDITSMLHEIASEDVMSGMGDVMKLLSNAQSRGFLTGMMGGGDFKAKFKGIVDQVRDVAKVLGTSLEEAMPLYSQMRQMGMWKTSDIMGTSMAIGQVGKQAAGALLGTMQQGAQQSWSMGGSMSAGANMGKNMFMNINSAVRSGVLSEEDVMDFTGGTGGVEGQSMMANRFGQGMSQFARSSAGRLSMAGLGEMRDGKFTGNVDEKKLRSFMSGNIGIDALQGKGMGRTSSRAGAASYTAHAGQLGQEVMSKGGLEFQASMFDAVLQRAGYGGADDDIRQIMIQQMSGFDERESQKLMKVMDDLPRIRREKMQRAQDHIRDSFRRMDERKNHSWQGFKDAVGFMVEQSIEKPAQKFAEGLTTNLGESVDRFTDMVWGRQRQASISGTEREKTLSNLGAGGLNAATGAGGLSSKAGNINLETSLTERLTMGPSWSRKNAFSQVADITNTSSVTFAAQRSIMRAQGATLDNMGYGESPDNRRDMDLFKSGVTKLFYNPKSAARLRELKEKAGANSGEYMNALIKELEDNGDPMAKKALENLTRGKADGAELTNAKIDMLSIGVRESGYAGELAPELGKHAKELAGVLSEPADIEAAIVQSQKDIAKFVSDANETTGSKAGSLYGAMTGAGINFTTLPISAALGAYQGYKKEGIGGILGGIAGLATGSTGVGGFFSDMVSGTGAVSAEALDLAMGKDWGQDMIEFFQKGAENVPDSNKFKQELAKKDGDPQAKEMHKRLGAADPVTLQKMLSSQQTLRVGKIASERVKEMQDMGARESRGLSGLALQTNIKQSAKDKYAKIVGLYASGKGSDADEAIRLSQELAQSGESIKGLGEMGDIGANIEALSRFEKFDVGSRGMGGKSFATQFNKMGEGAGLASFQSLLGSEEFGGKIKKMLSDDNISRSELKEIKEMGRRSFKGAKPGEEAAVSQEQMVKNLSEFANASQQYTWTATACIAKLQTGEVGDLQKVRDQVANNAKNLTNSHPNK
jgi:hypothetical protein